MPAGGSVLQIPGRRAHREADAARPGPVVPGRARSPGRPRTARPRKNLLAVGQHAPHGLLVGLVHQGGLAEAHLAARGLLGEDVAHILAPAAALAAAGERETLGGGAPGLDLGQDALLVVPAAIPDAGAA